jgi:hypothetical protein
VTTDGASLVAGPGHVKARRSALWTINELSALKRSVILSAYAPAGVDHDDRPGAAPCARTRPGDGW